MNLKRSLGKMLALATALAMALAMALALAACGTSGTLAVSSDNDGVHAKATGGISGSANGNIVIKEGYGLCINHIVEKGSFHVKATDESGKVVFDADITNNIADFVDAQGDIEMIIEAKDAVGTIDVIPYDIAAQAQADAKLDTVLDEVGVDRDSVGLPSTNASADASGSAGASGSADASGSSSASDDAGATSNSSASSAA